MTGVTFAEDHSDNEEDLHDLEVRLYSQVHHDAVPPMEVAGREQTEGVPGPDVANVDNVDGGVIDSRRYWVANDKSVVSQHRKFVRSEPMIRNATVGSPTVQNTRKESRRSEPGATLSASGGGPEKRRSINPFSMKGAGKKSRNKQRAQGKAGEESARYLDRKMRKLEQRKKLNKKRAKSRQAQPKKSKNISETIVLESSDEEEVIVIPVPPPPIVTLDSSGEEDEQFAKPNPKRISEKMPGTGNSRCNSPNSVMSDDFIVQQDKKRLLVEVKDVAEDEELPCADFDARTQCPIKEGNGNGAAMDFAAPVKRANKQPNQNQLTYEVTQSNFRAVDVYESESSDMPESVYAKGKRRKQADGGGAGGSDADEEEAIAKTKRLRKRKASGSCKSSEPNDESSDSEELDHSATALPYISRGEAVENCKQKAKKRQISNHEAINAADQEFMDKLSNIVHGNDERSPEMDEGHDSSRSTEGDITARDIAEEVLRNAMKNSDAIEEERAIPNKAIVDLDLLNVIDGISTQLDDFQEPPRHGRDPSPEVFFEDNSQKGSIIEIVDDNSSKAEKKNSTQMPATQRNKKQNKLAFMHVVYTNRSHVTWNEEMVRFYEFSWGQEKFNVDRILRLMDRNSTWRVKNVDRFPRAKRYSNIKCHNCCEFGHRFANCPLPRKDLICFICGDIGHKEPRCPNTICLRCGAKTNVFTRSCNKCIKENQIICPICRIRGHSIDLCPDKWRRYHSTTAMNEHPNSQVHYNDKKHCCICAGRGHLAEHCRSSNKLNEYHPQTTEIRYHSKTYEDADVKDPLTPGVYGVHLMSYPDENVTFPFRSRVTKNQYYGRFLEAVDLFDPPESKIVKNLVLNPFAKNAVVAEKGEKPLVEGIKSKADASDIQLNVSGVLEINDNDDSEETKVQKKNVETAKFSPKGPAEAVVTLDTDSNYSFSEHFPSIDKTEDESASILTIDRKQSIGPLPDFIPIFDDDEPKVATKRDAKSIGALPDFISLNDSDDDEAPDHTQIDEETGPGENCEGKIYLNKFHSQYLLSPAGTTYLIEASRRHNVKVSMDWTAVGNVLVIEGPTSNQDKFHVELMEKMKLMSDEKNRHNLEQSQKLPRAREALIRALQENILNLEKDLGDVQEIYKKMKYNESHHGKSSFKSAERNRRTLNMILMGQASLREGSMHLSILQDKLRELQVSLTDDQVSDDFREEIDNNYRYIFSSMRHNNYEQLIRQYTAMKRLNQIPKLELDYKLLGRKVLDTQFSQDQKEQFSQTPVGSETESKPEEQSPMESPHVPRTEFGVSPRKQREHQQQRARDLPVDNDKIPPPPPFHFNQKASPGGPGFQRGFNPPNQQHFGGHGSQKEFKPPNQRPFQRSTGRGRAAGNNNGTFVANKVNDVCKKWDARTNASLNELTTPPKMEARQEKHASVYWSRECIKFIARCMSINGLQAGFLQKFARLSERAANNMLSFNDFLSIKRIYFNLLKADRRKGSAAVQHN